MCRQLFEWIGDGMGMKNIYRVISVCLVLGVLAGCASTGGDRPNKTATAKPVAWPEVTLENVRPSSIWQFTQELTLLEGGGLVMLHGLADKPLPPYRIDGQPYAAVVDFLAQATESEAVFKESHYFVAPEAVMERLAYRLPALSHGYDETLVQVQLNSGQRLFNALSALSMATGRTIVADNAVAEVACGYVLLPEMPLPKALEAILKSARVTADSISIVSEQDYIFIRHPETVSVWSRRGNIADTSVTRKLLGRQVDLRIPEVVAADGVRYVDDKGAPLSKVLPELQEQLGVRIDVDPAMMALPVNPVVMQGVPLGSAMDLLVGQWLAPEIYWTLDDAGRVVIRTR